MNTYVQLPLQGSMAQRGACKHDQCQGNMTIHVVNHGVIKSISTHPTVIRPLTEFDVDSTGDCLRHEVKWTLDIRYELSTLPALDLDHVHHFPHALLPEKKLIVYQKRINQFQMLCGGLNAVEIIQLCNVIPA
jgi:hypothetical protein